MASGNDCPYHHSSTFRLFPKSGTFFNGARDSDGFRINNILSRSHSSLLENGSSSGCTVVRNKVHSVSFGSSNSRQSSLDSSTSANSMSSGGGDVFLFNGGYSPTSSSSPCKSIPNSPTGPKFKLIHEGDIHVCRLNHTRTVISKILSSKFLRRWETHHLYLSQTEIYSKTTSGFMEDVIPYTVIEDVYIVTRWDATQKYCVRVVLPDGSLLLQVNNAYVRDQWLHSILWKRCMLKYRKLLASTRRPEVLIKELKGLAELSLTTPLQDDCILQYPLEIMSNLLQEGYRWIPKSLNEDMISSVCPLLELTTPTAVICDYFSKYCQENPRSRVVTEMFTPVVQRILKHNMDFGKYPRTRVFVQVYAQALSCQNDGRSVLEKFIHNIHGVSSTCPHPRVLPNLVSICLAAVYSLYEERRNFTVEDRNNNQQLQSDWESRLLCFTTVMEIISLFEDWRPSLSQLLQPIPFPDDALAHSFFTLNFKPVIENIVCDYRCDVHLMVLGVRDEKEGWLLLYCPGGIACDDDGELWSKMLKQLLSCCCRRKRFLETLNKSIGPCMLRALRGDEVLQSTLCSMLELEVAENKDLQLQLITTLQSTSSGRKHYGALCQRQQHLRELQQKGGPRKLTLPSRSTDADVSRLLSHGSFGNLECLSLAFTQVTSACAEQLIKLPSLRYLNLWSTQFGDAGLQLISEHLHKLQVLNLCETPVTDKGLLYLSAIKNLKKLNLNSTNLSAQTFEKLKQKLPALQECDIRYTDAW